MTNPKKNRKVFNIILAIVLAVGVWLYVINVENPTGTVPIRDIPVSLVGEDSLAERGLMVTDQSRDSVNLKLSGRRKTLMKLNRKNLTLELDVSTITSEGEHTISCRASFPNNIGTDNVSVSDWEDLRVTVTVEKQETKEIPVRGEFIGTEAENCLAGAVSTDPETITRPWTACPMPWPPSAARKSATPLRKRPAWSLWGRAANRPRGKTSPWTKRP